MTQPDICVIIPTIREFECIESYLDNARKHGFDTDRLEIVFITEDFCDTAAMAALNRHKAVEFTV